MTTLKKFTTEAQRFHRDSTEDEISFQNLCASSVLPLCLCGEQSWFGPALVDGYPAQPDTLVTEIVGDRAGRRVSRRAAKADTNSYHQRSRRQSKPRM